MCLSTCVPLQLYWASDGASMGLCPTPAQAEFTDANTLRLTGVSSTAQFYGSGGHSATCQYSQGQRDNSVTALGYGVFCPVVTCRVVSGFHDVPYWNFSPFNSVNQRVTTVL